jgi:hypothetical protein
MGKSTPKLPKVSKSLTSSSTAPTHLNDADALVHRAIIRDWIDSIPDAKLFRLKPGTNFSDRNFRLDLQGVSTFSPSFTQPYRRLGVFVRTPRS